MSADQQFVTWLLEAHTPSIRYLTLRRLLDLPEGDSAVQAARRDMAAEGPIPAILAQQAPEGHWHTRRSFYSPKYTSTHWSMMLLAELCADPADPRVQRGVDAMLETTSESARLAVADRDRPVSCFWGNLLRYAAACGDVRDPRVEPVVQILVGIAHGRQWRCRINDGLPCAWGAVRALWGLAALPADLRTPQVERAIESGVGFLREGGLLVTASYPTPGKIHPLWFRLNWPLFYQADILFVLRVLAELGALDHPGVRPALAWLESRRRPDGRWRGASPYRSRTWEALADAGDTDRWVSLHAAIVLRAAVRV